MLVHLINLDRSAKRLADFRTLNGHLSEVLRFSAIDGQRLNVPKLVRAGVAEGDILTSYTLGAVGAAMSHIALWEIAVSTGALVTIWRTMRYSIFLSMSRPAPYSIAFRRIGILYYGVGTLMLHFVLNSCPECPPHWDGSSKINCEKIAENSNNCP